VKVVSAAALVAAYPVDRFSSLSGRGGFALGPDSSEAWGFFLQLHGPASSSPAHRSASYARRRHSTAADRSMRTRVSCNCTSARSVSGAGG
jgi:hypothetical protein